MLKHRLIPVLNFNGFSLVKTKRFTNPRMVGNPIQAAKIFNKRNVDELVFIDIKATEQNRKINLDLVSKIIDECFMPVTIGGGIETFEDISNLLKIGADKVIIKSKAITNPDFILEAVNYFGSQCISISLDVEKIKDEYLINNIFKKKIKLNEFIDKMNQCNVGEYVVNSVNNDGMMNGFDIDLYKLVQEKTIKPLVALGGGGKPDHFNELISSNYYGSLAGSSIFYFTQYTPNDVKLEMNKKNKIFRV